MWIVALRNSAMLDGFTDIMVTVVGVVNALVERYGCLNMDITVLSLMPRPLASVEQVDIVKKQNVALFKVVHNMVRQKRIPVKYVSSHKWFLKRVKSPDGSCQIEVDTIYYEEGSDQLNQDGQVHLHLFLANMLRLKRIYYEWTRMPVVKRRESHGRVFQQLGQTNVLGREVGNILKQLKKGHGNRQVSCKLGGREWQYGGDSEGSPPLLV